MTERKPRPEDSKVETAIEFTIAVYRDFKERGYEPDIALRLTQIAVLDLRLYDIMRSLDTIADIQDNRR
jgi:hypothetical protein